MAQKEPAWQEVLEALAGAAGKMPGLAPGKRLLVACSGGADSVVLLQGLLETRGKEGLGVAHVDHGMRPGSEKDREFVESLAGDLGLPFLVRPLRMGTPRGGSTGETRARELRYRAFMEMAREWKAGALATAHHASDQVETILFRIFRGTGIAGLEGMPQARRLWLPDGPWVVRPLLEVPGEVIRAAARERGLPFVEDPTNQETNATRNRIRHEVLPLLMNRLGPRVLQALHTLSADAARLQETLRAEAGDLLDRVGIQDFGPLREIHLPLPSRPLDLEILVEALRQGVRRLYPDRWIGPPPVFLEACRKLARKGREGARAEARGLAAAVLYRGEMVLFPLPLPGPLPEISLPGPEEVEILPGLQLKIEGPVPPPDRKAVREAAPFQVYLDARELTFPLTIRSRRQGDEFQPLGTSAPRSLKNFLVSRKVPWWRKDLVPLAVDARGRIAWVAGVEISHPHRVKTTKRCRVYIFRFSPTTAEFSAVPRLPPSAPTAEKP